METDKTKRSSLVLFNNKITMTELSNQSTLDCHFSPQFAPETQQLLLQYILEKYRMDRALPRDVLESIIYYYVMTMNHIL